ncbi:MAG TPA: DUF4870 domain-containing protein [Selenomonadales bacterium]|nr:DUF4870 domain-containing protein [Selenomonadales bacterium]
MDSISGEQKLLALIAHLSYFLGGLGFIIAPLVIFLLKKDDPFVYDHARQALVAHIALLAVSVVTGLLCMVLIGVLLVPVLIFLFVVLVVTSIIASLRALDGQLYRYPFIQGLVDKLT